MNRLKEFVMKIVYLPVLMDVAKEQLEQEEFNRRMREYEKSVKK